MANIIVDANANPMTTGGDVVYGGASGAPTRLGNGTANQVLTSSGGTGAPTWANSFANPMTTGGDIIYGGASGAPTRLANGSAGQHLQSNGGTSAPNWSSPNYQLSASSGAYESSVFNTETAITNLSVTITTIGRPVMLTVVPDGSANDSYFGGRDAAGGGAITFTIGFKRGATRLTQSRFSTSEPATGTVFLYMPVSALSYIDIIGAGTYTYTVYFVRTSNMFDMFYAKLLAYEL